jgi:hypothetical protein
VTDRTFDYVPRLVEANLPYRMGATDPALLDRSRFWVPGPVLDQGREGACVGFGCTAEYLASPVRGRPPALDSQPNLPAVRRAELLARDVYLSAQRIDAWEGEAYEGTSVRAGMLVGRERGWWTGFRWAMSMAELRAALELGPVVVGVEWREGMYRAPGGVVTVDGRVVGGHALLITGYSARRRAWRWRNSWSRSYGVNGSAYIRHDDLDSVLFRAGGEAAVPVGRRL